MRATRLRTAILRGALAIPLVAAVGVTTASAHSDHRHQKRTEYVITELGSLGGTSSAGNSINNRGWVMGTSNLPGDEVVHATLWRHGSTIDLGTLGGPNSAVLFLNRNNRGLVVGVAETADMDPREELWSCFFFFPSGVSTGHACRGFVWERGEMRALPTHGGTHGFAAGVNNRGQVVGWAETSIEDPTCNDPQELGFIGALWDTRRGDRIQKLPPLPGTDDSASTGNAINDRGQVVGISGDCANAVGGFSARHAVLWENGQPTDIGDFGGEAWNTPIGINNKGVVVGFANAAGTEGDTFNERPFTWTKRGGIRDLGTLPDDTRGQALGVNDRGQIVGLSRATGERDHAVIWNDGKITDLNEVARGYDGHLLFANDINDAGVISGAAISAETGETVAFVATPVGKRR